MRKNKKIGLIIVLVLLAAIGFGGFKLTEPSYALRMDVNPSIEIVSNKLNRVVEVNPLNDDAKEMLKNYKIGGKDLKNTIEDLADLMVLKGYISGGKDNLVMITVDDNNASSDMVNKLNEAIAAYLENKQIEATIVNQSIPKDEVLVETGKEVAARRISQLDEDLDYDKISNMTLRELIELAELKNIDPEKLFNRITKTVTKNDNSNRDNIVNNNRDHDDDDRDDKDDNKNKANTNTNDTKTNTNTNSKTNSRFDQLIGEARAKEIALDLVKGEIVEFKLDDYDDDGDDDTEYEIKIIANGYKYEIEIDAYTGKVTEFERDGKANIKNTLIGEAKAKEIALGLANGKIVKFELDDDDDAKYEIEIIANGYEYEIEINAYTGEVLEFEKDN